MTVQNIPHGCALSPSNPKTKSFKKKIAGQTSISFKVAEIGNAWKTAGKNLCESVELKITSFSVQAFDKSGHSSNTLNGSTSICFSVPGGGVTSCPIFSSINNASKGGTAAAAQAEASGDLRIEPPDLR